MIDATTSRAPIRRTAPAPAAPAPAPHREPAPSAARAPVDTFEAQPASNQFRAFLAQPPMPSQEAATQAAVGVDLGPGARGPAVEALQRSLVELGHMTQADMNTGPGTFGPRTERAVRSFQAASGLPNTGYCGPQTRAALDAALEEAREPVPPVPTRDLARGMTGPDVTNLQSCLVKEGFLSQTDMDTGPGVFGPKTESALKAFQATHRVPTTGYFGPLTRDALTQALATPGASAPSSSGAIPPTKQSVVGASMGDGTVEGALTWSQDQMPGGTQRGVNVNNYNQTVGQNANAWNSWCLGFVNTAYGRQIPELMTPSAISSYHAFNNQGRINTSRNIPAGAPVYFAATPANGYFGHVVLATGKTTPSGDPIIRSTGWNGRPGIFEMPLSEMEAITGAYLGYAVM